LDSAHLSQLENEADLDYERGSLERALERYRSILTEAPDHAPALNRIGAILAQQGDLEGAEASLREAVAADPTLAGAHSNLGNIMLTRGDARAALACYQEAVRLEPESPVFHENLAAAYKRLGNITNMVSELKKSQRLVASGPRRDAGDGRVKSLGKRLGCMPTAVLLIVALAALVALLS